MTITALRLDLDGRTVIVTLRRSARARRLSLRIDPKLGPLAVLPPRISPAMAEIFVRKHQDWLSERLSAVPERAPFVSGALVPLLDVPHRIEAVPAARRGVWAEDGVLFVSGRPEHLARRVSAFLKDEAKRRIYPHAFELAGRIGRVPARITVREVRSRWGSCSSRGDLSFSWRLVMAPAGVLSYVVAHEVAHLAEMNHSPAFWRVVADLAGDPAPAKQWLKANGAGLHRFG